MFRNTPKLLIITLLVAALTIPAVAQRGSADFTRYVALGDSLTAGFANYSLLISHQQWSYPAVIARQAGTPNFEQPLVSQPGIPAELQLTSLSPLIIGPKSGGVGTPINLQLPRPYNNLGIPQADAPDLLTKDGSTENDPRPYFRIVLRGQAPAVHQALALQPTFISLWIGSGDVITALTEGNLGPLTPIEVFQASYEGILDALVAGAPNAGMVTATVPPVTAIPFARVLPPVLIDPATRQPIPGPDGNPIFLIAEFGDGTVGQLNAMSLVTLNAQPFLATGYGIPAALAPVIPLPNVGKPLPNQVVVDSAEVVVIEQRRQEINQVILSAAAERNIPVLDVEAIFAEFVEGVEFGGIELSLDFLTGGIMSFDGIHPTDIGNTLIANEFLRVINDAYGAGIPYASLIPFFSNNAPVDASLVLPPWMELNLLEAPWTEFSTLSFDFELTEPDEPAEEESGARGRTIRRGPRG